MIIKKNISVWLVVVDGVNKGKIALQRRSVNEKKYPYIHQATWSGKTEENESAMDAVKRECKEELGEEFYKAFEFNKLIDLGISKAVDDEVEWECSNFSGEVNEKLLKLVKMHNDACNEFVFVGKNDLFYPMESGKNPEKNIVLFDDQYKILKELLSNED